MNHLRRAKDEGVDKLGFEVRTDQTMDGFRWLTVGPPSEPELELILLVPGPPMMPPETAEHPKPAWRDSRWSLWDTMATGFASALSEGQPAQLDLGDEAVPCLVVGFSGADVVLAPSEPVPPSALAPDTASYLLIEAGGSLQALKARVRPGLAEGELVATLLDPFRLGQRRNFSRAPLVMPAHLRPLGAEDPPTTTFTRDISAGGLRVALQTSYREADVHEVVIGLVQANREITGTAETVRVTATDVSLCYIDIDPADRLLLAQLTFAYHRRRGAP